MVSAIILAGGLSERMGDFNKLLLPYNNKTIIGHLTNAICNAGIKEVIVVTGYQGDAVRFNLQNSPVNIIHNARYAEGMTTSIQAGISNANGKGYMICLADMVKITSDEYSFIKEAFEAQLNHNKNCITVPRYNSTKGNPVIFSSTYKESILTHSHMNGCSEIVRSNKENINWADMKTGNILHDIDLYKDYQELAN